MGDDWTAGEAGPEVVTAPSGNDAKPAEAASALGSKPPNGTADTDVVRLEPTMNVFNGVTIICGIIIGSGIFISPTFVMNFNLTGSVGLSLVIWAACGVFSMALCYGELSSMITMSSGDCAYLFEGFGVLPTFFLLVLWVTFFIRLTAQAVIFLMLTNYLLHPFFMGDCDVSKEAVILAAICIILCGSLKPRDRIRLLRNKSRRKDKLLPFDLKKCKREVKRMDEELEAMTKSLPPDHEMIAALQEEFEQKTDQIIEEQHEANQVAVKKVKKVEKERDELNEIIEEQHEANQVAVKKVKKVEKERDELNEANQVAVKKVKKVEKERDELDEAKQVAEKKVKKVEKERDELDEAKQVAVKKVKKVEKERDELDEAKQVAEKKVKTVEKERDVAVKKVKKVEKERDELDEMLDEEKFLKNVFKVSHSIAASQQSKMEQVKDAWKKKAHFLGMKLLAILKLKEEQMQELEEESSAKGYALSKLYDENETLHKAVDNPFYILFLKQAENIAEKKIKTLQREIDEKVKERNKTVKALQDERDKLKEGNNNLLHQNGLLENELGELERNLKDAIADMRLLKKEINTLERQLKDKIAAYEDLAREYQCLVKHSRQR